MRKLIYFLTYVILVGIAVAKEIDLRTMSDQTGDYDIAFCARPTPDATGKPGHAFVAFSHQLPNGERDFLAIGHTVGADVTPAKAAWSYFGSPASGLLKEERYTAIKQNCLDAQVNKKDYDRARAFTANPLAQLGIAPADGVVLEAYKLGADDCMTFLIDVATSLKASGLTVPQRKPLAGCGKMGFGG
jgi:hypothetical protein